MMRTMGTPLQRPAEDEDQHHHDDQDLDLGQIEGEQGVGQHRRRAQPREHRAEEVGRRDQEEDQDRDLQRLDQGLLEPRRGHLPVAERHQQRAERAAGRALGRGRPAEQDRAEGERNEQRRGHEAQVELGPHLAHVEAERLVGQEPAVRPHQGEEDGRVHREIDCEREQPVQQALSEQRRRDDLVDDERGRDEQSHRHHDGGDELQPHAAGGLRTFVLRQRRAQLGVQPTPDQGVGGVQAGEENAGDDGGGEQIGDRHLQHRPHDHQHDRRRDQDPQRTAGGDGAGREPHVVVGPVHGLRGHDAEDGHRRPHDAGGGREDG